MTNNLRTTLEKERVKNKRTVEELTIKAETARNEPEIQARNLREKLNRLQDETQPIINLYKVFLQCYKFTQQLRFYIFKTLACKQNRKKWLSEHDIRA